MDGPAQTKIAGVTSIREIDEHMEQRTINNE
jgi:hypothetical protein